MFHINKIDTIANSSNIGVIVSNPERESCNRVRMTRHEDECWQVGKRNLEVKC